MNNLTQKINKLLFALKQKGLFYRITTSSFYLGRLNKYCKKYELYIRIETEENDKEEKKRKHIKILDTFKQIDVLKYLIDELKDYSNETGGDADVPRETNAKTKGIL